MAMAAVKALLFALCAGLAAGQTPTCVDTDSTFIEVIDVLETVMSNSMQIKQMMQPLQDAFCIETQGSSPLCNGGYTYTPSRPGGAAGCPPEQVYCPVGGGPLSDTCNNDCSACVGFTTSPPLSATTPSDTCM